MCFNHAVWLPDRPVLYTVVFFITFGKWIYIILLCDVIWENQKEYLSFTQPSCLEMLFQTIHCRVASAFTLCFHDCGYDCGFESSCSSSYGGEILIFCFQPNTISCGIGTSLNGALIYCSLKCMKLLIKEIPVNLQLLPKSVWREIVSPVHRRGFSVVVLP